MENYFERDFPSQASTLPLKNRSEKTNYFEQDFPSQQQSSNKSAYEEMFPEEAAYEKEQSYGPSGATMQQAYLATLPRTKEFQAYSGEKAGLDVQGFDEKGRMMIRNPQTGDIAPLTRGFFKDNAATIGTWIKPAAKMATMAVMDTLGTVATGTPIGGAALGSAAAGASDLVFQKAAQDWIGEPMSMGHAAGETAGAGAGYATFGAAAWGAKGFARMVQKAIPKLGDGAKEMIQGVTQVKKEPLDFLWEEMKSLKPGEPIEKLIHEKYLSLNIPQRKARNAIFGAEDAPHTLENLMGNFQRNLRSTGGDPKKIEALHAMYMANLGPEADEALMKQLATNTKNVLLDPKATSEDGLSLLTDKVVGALEHGERVASRAFGMKKSSVLRAHGNKDFNISSANNSFLTMLGPSTEKRGGFGHTDLIPFGVDKEGNKKFIHVFNEDKLSKSAIDLYADFMRKIGFEVGEYQGKTAVFEARPNSIKLKDLWKSLEDFQTKFDKAIDPFKGSMTDSEAAPLAAYIEKLREIKVSADPKLAEYNKMWTDLSEVKKQFKAAKAAGYTGEKGMIQKFKEISANASGKNETFSAAQTKGLRDTLAELDSYKFMKGRELVPMIDEGVASAKLGNMLRTGKLNDAVNSFSATMQHALPQTGNIASEQAKEALKAIDDSLPKDKKFLWETQRHLTNLAFNKPGSIYQARWLAMALASMLGMTHLGPAGILAGVGIASKIQKPKTFATKVIPYLTRAGKSATQPPSNIHGAAEYLGRQAFAQAGRKAGGTISSQ